MVNDREFALPRTVPGRLHQIRDPEARIRGKSRQIRAPARISCKLHQVWLPRAGPSTGTDPRPI
eukprot:2819135-Pyramimonas_sp.AAC.1